MKFVNLKSNLNEKIYNCYIVAGDDAYLRISAENLIKAKTAVNFPEMNINYIESDISAGAMIDSFNTLPLMNDYKVLILRGYEPQGEDAKKQLLEYFKNPNPASVIVFVTKSDFLRKLSDIYPDICALVDCSFMDTVTIKRWLAREFSAASVGIEERAADLLCNYCGYDMTRLASETPKLAAFGKPLLSEEDIRDLVVPETAYQVYELSNKISEKNADKALAILQSLLYKNDSPGSLLQTIYNHFRRMFYISVSKESDAALAQKLGVKEYAVKKTREALFAYRPARLKKILDTIYKSEVSIKTGKMKDIDALYYTVLKII